MVDPSSAFTADLSRRTSVGHPDASSPRHFRCPCASLHLSRPAVSPYPDTSSHSDASSRSVVSAVFPHRTPPTAVVPRPNRRPAFGPPVRLLYRDTTPHPSVPELRVRRPDPEVRRGGRRSTVSVSAMRSRGRGPRPAAQVTPRFPLLSFTLPARPAMRPARRSRRRESTPEFPLFRSRCVSDNRPARPERVNSPGGYVEVCTSVVQSG